MTEEQGTNAPLRTKLQSGPQCHERLRSLPLGTGCRSLCEGSATPCPPTLGAGEPVWRGFVCTPLNTGVSGCRRVRAPTTEGRDRRRQTRRPGRAPARKPGGGRQHGPLTRRWQRGSGSHRLLPEDRSQGQTSPSALPLRARRWVAAGRGRGTNRSRRSSRKGTCVNIGTGAQVKLWGALVQMNKMGRKAQGWQHPGCPLVL